MMINRNNPLPLYVQLKHIINEKIETGEWKRGEATPTELELQKSFDLSRTTVRQALTELVFEGVLERVQGKGTFVADKKLEPIRPGLTGFTQDMEAQGHEVSSIIVDKKMIQPEMDIQRSLGLKDGEQVWKLERIRLVNDVPIGYHETYLNTMATPNVNLDKYDFVSDSLYVSLEREGLILGDSDETVEAMLPNKSYAEIFEIDPNVPVLNLKRIVRLSDGTPYEFSNMHYRADKYKYTIKLRSGGQSSNIH
ncbi:GntR family transcriptional regulator [Gracilibacillus alcaliphilus]|uniref:GntR family transcriptional regulator n=1 Tax=Gracilibacillus alcaliphilus TaxID=1401441 RepID=UPI0019570386|nr:GntR family transcriptional regulator [Gracilibacillus alcaliphilus]MBM7676846.1 GntR family transcriptional regulator [Gracilibacillus alcaliphilus]